MDRRQLVSRYPQLYHMAEPTAWQGIKQHGLMSTTALLDLFEVEAGIRAAIEARRRAKSVTIEHPTHGRAVIRDNKPLSVAKLAKALPRGTTVAEFLRLLNFHTFFWLSEQRLTGFRRAGAYRNREHLVLTVETKGLIERYGDQVRLSPINSGSTYFIAAPRSLETLHSIEDYPYDDRCRLRGSKDAIAELAVEYAVPTIVDLTIRAVICHVDGEETVVYP